MMMGATGGSLRTLQGASDISVSSQNTALNRLLQNLNQKKLDEALSLPVLNTFETAAVAPAATQTDHSIIDINVKVGSGAGPQPIERK